ncbi:MAG: T9SS type A sorting domain-containing protein [Ferruginibacter sp.]
MKNIYRHFFSVLIVSLIFLIPVYQLNAQVQTPKFNTSITTNTNGFYEYLPVGYSTGNQTYPLIVYVHGLGECGDGSTSQLPRVLNAGPPMQINQGIFPQTFTVAGQTHSFIVISPQFVGWPNEAQLSSIVDYAVANYRVDINRIYMTGISMGAGVLTTYAGYSPYNSNRLAAIVPVALAAYPWSGYMENMANANLAVWATHNDSDNVVPPSNTILYVDGMNGTSNPPTPSAKKTLFRANGHDAWSMTYNLTFTEDGLNVYRWMLQFKRNFIVTPVTGLEFNAGKKDNNILLQWKTLTETNSRGFEVQRSNDGVNFTTLGFINSKSISGSGAEYSYTDILPLSGKNYYRLKQIDNDNNGKLSVVRFVDLINKTVITIYPNPVSDVININNTGSNFKRAFVRIFDNNGKLVKQQELNGSNTISIPVNDLPKAIYTGEIQEGETITRFRFVKQ